MVGDTEGASGMHEGCEQHLLCLRPHERQGPGKEGSNESELRLLYLFIYLFEVTLKKSL